MPLGNEMPVDNQLIKALIIGNSKVGKTHYAMQAAADGFKVLYIDGDVSRPTMQQFDSTALSRVFYLPFGDAIASGGQYIPRFVLLLRQFLSTGTFNWNDTKSRMLQPAHDEGDNVWQLNASTFGSDWVIVIDSWTSISHSIMSAIALNSGIDLADMDKASLGIYGSANNMATDILSRIRTLNSHVIVIAHPDEYVKYKVKPGNVRDAQRTENREIEWSRMVPKSISRPHAMTMPSYFTDVAWLLVSQMEERIIDFRPAADRDSGGRFDTKLSVQEGAFARLVERAGGQVPTDATIADEPALVHIPKYEAPKGTATQPTLMNPSGATLPAKVQLGVKSKLGLNLKPKA